ncbi:MAG: hypothetical protein Q9217_000280 [Psora testacea]
MTLAQSASGPWDEPYTGDHLSEVLGPAYTFDVDTRRRFSIEPYNALWPQQFQAIKADLVSDLAEENVKYMSIEHIGSTSVPGLASRAITDPPSEIYRQAVIDISIVVAASEFTLDKLEQFKEALFWGNRQGGYRYIGDGGVEDRWSFKVQGVVPLRNLYVVAQGSIPLRAYISLRETLRVDAALRQEYEQKKRQLAKMSYDNVLQYCNLKRPVIRKIFLKDGWTHEEVDKAEEHAKRDWPRPTPAEFYGKYEDFFLESKTTDQRASMATPAAG